MAVDVVTTEQQRYGTYRERFLQIKEEFHKLMEAGGTPGDMEGVLVKLLKDMEDLRLKNELQVRRLEKEIAVCHATAKACTTYSNLVVSSISFYRRQRQNVAVAGVEPEEKPNGGNGVPRDTDVLKTICLCGCQDEIDSADCDCECHTEGVCQREDCVFCRSQPRPKSKKVTKKGPTRKKSYTKKKATKKSTRKK